MRNEIVRLYYGGTSMRKIAQTLRISRHTVKRVLTEHDGGRSGESPSSRRKRPSQLDAYEATILALLERYPDITAMRVLEELRKEGFSGGYTIVKERVGRLRPHRRKQPVMRFETSPGAQAQMDYATYTIDFTGKGHVESTCSATCWATRDVNIFGSSSVKTSLPRSASTFGPSSISAAWRPPVFTTI